MYILFEVIRRFEIDQVAAVFATKELVISRAIEVRPHLVLLRLSQYSARMDDVASTKVDHVFTCYIGQEAL
jgi:hypothetical protein